MQRFLPIVFAYFYLVIPAAVVLYMIISTIIRIITQDLMFRAGVSNPNKGKGRELPAGDPKEIPAIDPAPSKPSAPKPSTPRASAPKPSTPKPQPQSRSKAKRKRKER